MWFTLAIVVCSPDLDILQHTDVRCMLLRYETTKIRTRMFQKTCVFLNFFYLLNILYRFKIVLSFKVQISISSFPYKSALLRFINDRLRFWYQHRLSVITSFKLGCYKGVLKSTWNLYCIQNKQTEFQIFKVY